MYVGRTIFAQVMDGLPLRRFHTCVRHYGGDRKIKTFTCLDQLRVMAFAQLTYRQSLRDIETCLHAMQPKLYPMGIGSRVSRNTLAHANEVRDWRIYADFAQVLISRARQLYANEDFGEELEQATLYALDASTIDLCLSLFPWARFRRAKAAIKLHTLMDLRGSIPVFIHVSDGKLHDVNALDLLLPQAGAFYIMDRGYLDFARLFTLHQAQAFFVTRAKSNVSFQRRYSHPVDRTTGLICDQTIVLTGFYSSRDYPQPLRRIRYIDPDTGKRFVFLTNHFDLPALTIARLYKARWR
ncbi:MAG: IS4 family transposase, partial [Phycisphaerales bacterium]